MNQRLLGCTSLTVSELCLGTMNFGWRTDEAASTAILDAYLAHGGNFIQARGLTVDPVFSPVSPTFSESIVGQWWRARGLARHDLVLATRITVGEPPLGAGRDLGVAVVSSVEASLRRFQTDYLDLLVLEWTGAGSVPERVRLALDQLVRRGCVRYLAVANVPVWRIAASLQPSGERVHRRFDAVQADYSLLTRVPFECDLAELCREQRLGFLARAPLAGGLLTRRAGRSAALTRSRRAWLDDRFGPDGSERVTRVLTDVAAEAECTPAQAALRWLLQHLRVTSALIGVTTVDQLHEAVAATHVHLDASQSRRLDHASRVQRLVAPARTTGTREVAWMDATAAPIGAPECAVSPDLTACPRREAAQLHP